MVVRIFRATPKQVRLRDYEKFVIEEAMPIVRKAKGCMEAKALKSLGVVREILFITVWDNLESVKAFMGKTWNQVYFIGHEAEMVEQSSADVKHYHQIASF
jgi:quinol monooxygenase YgiN